MKNSKSFKMMPIGPLMIEHRLIERMVKLMKNKLERIAQEKQLNTNFIEIAVDFFRTYADRCHHGKEENILFRELNKKELSWEHKKIPNELIEEHVFGRKTVGRLVDAKERYAQGMADAKKEAVEYLRLLVEFYPVHIEKEDKHFFIPCMSYFTQKEKNQMLEEGWEFDRKMIHEKYQNIVKELEG
jgi:hemerythrin-like domain-containing protein